MASSIGFAETAAQWHALRAMQDRELEIVPVLPETDALAAASGAPYRTVEDLCDHTTIVQRGDANTPICDAICDAIDGHLRELAREHPRQEWVTAHAYFHPLKGAMDCLVRRAIPVIAALREPHVRELVCFEMPAYEISGLGLLDKPALSMTSHIAPRVAVALGVALHWCPAEFHLPEVPDPGAGPQVEPSAPERLPGEGWNTAGQALLLHRLFADLGTRTFDAWHESGFGTNQRFDAVFAEQEIAAGLAHARPVGLVLWERVVADQTVREACQVDGIDLFDLVAPTLHAICHQGIPDLLAFAPVADRGLTILRNAVIAAGGMTERNSVVCRAAEEHGVPILSMHFGGYVGYAHMPMHERYDLGNADYFATGGEGGVRMMGSPRPEAHWPPERKRATPVALGSTWVEDIARETRAKPIDPPRRRIMYVMSALLGDNAYLGYIFHPEIWYQRFQRKLVETLLSYPEHEVIVKPPLLHRYPQIPNPTLDWLVSRSAPNLEILPDIPLTDVLDRADAFIVDSPSTPLVQIAATDKPFVLYCDRDCFLMDDEASELLRGRSAYADTEEEFFAVLREFMARPEWPRGPVDDRFLAQHVTAGLDGQAAQRTAAFLHEIATRAPFAISPST